MPDNSSSNKRIAKNTVLLFFRMMVIMLVTLYTSRVILQSLGIQDYGIYNMVGGVTSMFLIVIGSLSNASQRFITYALGKNDKESIREVFSTSLVLHLLIGIVIVLVFEPVGLWLIHNKLVIPVDRLQSATWVFHCSLLSMLIMLVSIPYNAIIIAHERMNIYAYISIFDAIGRLAVAYSLFVDSSIDKLILYGILLLVLQVCVQLTYFAYCRSHFEETRLCFTKNKTLFVDMAKFASWSVFGNAAFICCNQGISLILGMFFQPFVSAARGIAVQVQGALVSLVRNFQTAINPQITKTYAAGELNKMNNLVFTSSKLSFYLVLIPFLPIIFNTDLILRLWLKDVPEYAVVFTQFMIVSTSLNTLINPLEDSVKATGNLKRFELTVYGTKIMTLPVSYVLLKCGYSPILPFIVLLVSDLVSLAFSFLATKRLLGFSVKQYFNSIIIKVVSVSIVSILVSYFLHISFESRSVLVGALLSMLWTILTIWVLGLSGNERKTVNNLIINIKNRIRL